MQRGSGYLMNVKRGVVAKRLDWKNSLKIGSTGIKADGVRVAHWDKNSKWTIEKEVCTGGETVMNF